MRVFVTGGTGALGRRAVPALVSAGHDVTALARTRERGAALSGQGARPVEVSLFDAGALGTAMAGHDAVLNLATAIPPTSRALRTRAWDANQKIRTEGSAAVVEGALAAGVTLLVQESVVMIYRDGGDRWLDETAPTDDFPIARGNHAAEASAGRFAAGGGRGVVLRFGLFYGPGTAQTDEGLDRARRHAAVVLGRPGGYLSSIHLTDAATAVVHALRAGSGVFNVTDDEPVTKREYAEALAAAAGTSLWVRGPGRAAYLLGDRATSLTRSLRVGNRRFRAETGWAPRYPSVRDGLAATGADAPAGG